jgi:hypothetical protein
VGCGSHRLLRNHVRPYLGSRSLDRINAQAVRTWRKRLLDDGRTSIVAAKSYRLLRAVLNTAVNEDRLLSRIRAGCAATTRRNRLSGRSGRSRR